jgi:5-hydroxyisourate hydrolase-like protein (transthyretin family)
MYVLTALGRIMAWKQDGGLPLPVYRLSIEASPSQISTNASATLTATFLNVARAPSSPVAGVSIYFFGNLAQNQGYIDPPTVVTNNEGKATTKFYSQSRTGVVTVNARTPNGILATTTITITKGGQAPPTTGSIQGTVYALNGKPARNATVKLWSWEKSSYVATTTTNAKGKYSFQGLPFGSYTVYASADGAIGTTGVLEISQSSPAVTSPKGDVYLQ